MTEQKYLSDRKKACGACPFKRINSCERPKPGGSPVQVYLGQARGPFWLPCHKDKNYADKESNPATVQQCAGAAIFRANCKSGYTMSKKLLHLPEDKEAVFANEVEFAAHYSGLSPELLEHVFNSQNLDKLMQNEISSFETKIHINN